jgi:hypothetical protein
MVIKDGWHTFGADVDRNAAADDKRFRVIDLDSCTTHQLHEKGLEWSATRERP